jgi:hypothetical protein
VRDLILDAQDVVGVMRRIRTVFGDCDPRTVNLEDVSAWRQVIEEPCHSARPILLSVRKAMNVFALEDIGCSA